MRDDGPWIAWCARCRSKSHVWVQGGAIVQGSPICQLCTRDNELLTPEQMNELELAEQAEALASALAKAGTASIAESVATADVPLRETVDVAGAAALLHTTEKGIYQLRAHGHLPQPIGRGRRLIWRKSDLLECEPRVPSRRRSPRP